MPSKSAPKSITLPWDASQGIAASPDGSFVIVAGELGQLARIDTETWKAVPLANVEGSVDGRVQKLRKTDCRDAFAQLLCLSDDRFLLRPYNDPWRIVNARGQDVIEGPRRVHHCCLDGDGFATAYSTEVTRWTAAGKSRKKVKAKRRVEMLASIRGKLLLQGARRLELL